VVEVETSDFCKINVKVSYRVNFEGESTKWFSIENYVKFLCDHMRSKIRSVVRKHDVQSFYTASESIIRDIVLGKATESGKRLGTEFEENGMRIYDVEVLGVTLAADIEKLLIGSQREAMNHTLALATARRTLDFTKQNEQIKQATLEAQAETKERSIALQSEELAMNLELQLAQLAATQQTESQKQAAEKAKEDAATALHGIRLARLKAEIDQEAQQSDRTLARKLEEIEAEVEAVVKRGKAITPDLIAALSTFGEREMAKSVAEAMAPLAILGGGKKSVAEILADMLKGSSFAKQLMPAIVANGTVKTEAQPRS
jgi:major vault protein